jgi:hypothetical protein
MKPMRSRLSLGIGIVLMAGGSTALADTFVNPLDTVPKPNVVLGFDHSVTMGIQRDCSNCHAPGNPLTRLEVAKQDILQTMPLFRDYFTFGGFAYKGCGYAEVDQRVLPTPANPDTSFNAVTSMITGLTHCGSRENSLPNSSSAWTSCITPTTGCSGDLPIIQQILTGNPPGIALTQPAIISVTCDNPISPVPAYNIQSSLIAKLVGGGYSWPRWDPSSLNATEVQNDLCGPLENILLQIQNELTQCLLTPSTAWDMTFLTNPNWCDEAVIANTACTSWPTNGTCVCDQSVVGPTGETCFSAGVVASDCGIPLTFKARQQVAVCELYDVSAPGRFGDYYQNQPDNHVNGPLPNFCRENVGMIFTDGYMGDTSGVAAEAAAAIPTYLSVSGLSNLFVFRIADNVPDLIPFINAADIMQDELAGPTGLTAALLANDAPSMQSSFAQVLSRVFKGVYTGSSMSTDEFQTRAFINAFTVPGYSATLPVSDTYVGWPQYVSAHVINPDGSINPTPVWQSDWTSKAAPAPGCSSNPSTIAYDTSLLGPGGSFRNGVNRNVNLPANSVDRNGDGTPDSHPALTWGRMFGFASSEPVIVEAPREAPGGDQAASFALHQMSVRSRRRAVYVMSGGYVIGLDGGTFNAGITTYGSQRLSFSYTDNASSGMETMRYIPSWVNDSNADYQYGINDLVQQPILDGDLEAREVYDTAGARWRTVLAGSAGPSGRGFFTLDITDPCAVTLLGQWTLPGAADRASNEPKIYTIPTASGSRPALVVTGGLNGSNTIFAYAAVPATTSGQLYYSATLPGSGTATYAVTPVCVDANGSGYVTHCYALRSDGFLARVPMSAAGFGVPVDITPTAGPVTPQGGGRVYYTEPATFFAADGTVNLVYGSGDFENLTQASVANYVFKVTDEAVRKRVSGGTRADVTRSCYPDGGGSTVGVFPMAANERMIASPVVVGGGVYWTGYTGQTNGCISGTGNLYGINYETCYDILTPAPTTNRPAAKPIGDGIPLSPTIHRRANVVYTQTSAGPDAAQIGNENTRLRGGQKPIVKRLYWRPFVDIR